MLVLVSNNFWFLEYTVKFCASQLTLKEVLIFVAFANFCDMNTLSSSQGPALAPHCPASQFLSWLSSQCSVLPMLFPAAFSPGLITLSRPISCTTPSRIRGAFFDSSLLSWLPCFTVSVVLTALSWVKEVCRPSAYKGHVLIISQTPTPAVWVPFSRRQQYGNSASLRPRWCFGSRQLCGKLPMVLMKAVNK